MLFFDILAINSNSWFNPELHKIKVLALFYYFDAIWKKKNVDIVRFKFIIYSLYFPALVYISLAGSSLRSFILLGIVSVLPSIIESYERLAVKNE